MNWRQIKKHTMRNGCTYRSMYIDRKPLMPRAWFQLVEKISANVDMIPRKRWNSLKRNFRRKYYYTYKQREDLWENKRSWESLQLAQQYRNQQKMNRSKYKMLKRLMSEFKRVAESMTFSSVPEGKIFLTNKCEEFRKTMTEFYQHQNYKVVDVVADFDNMRDDVINVTATVAPLEYPINLTVIHDRNKTK